MTIERIRKRLEAGAAYWSEVPGLLQDGFQAEFLRTEPFDAEPRFHAILSHPETKSSRIVIARHTERVEPDLIDATSAVLAIATFTDEKKFLLPLLPAVAPSKVVTATLHHKTPKPDIKWTVSIGDRFYMGERKPMATTNINISMNAAMQIGATEVEVPISKPLRTMFRQREFRVRAMEAKLSETNTKIYTWSKQLGFPTNRFEKVVNRGDNVPEMRAAIVELTGLSEDELWPSIEWND